MAKAPHILSVEEAGREIGIGRTLAYAQARAWLATGGAEGFPCRRIGRLLHVFRAEFEAWLGFEITWPRDEAVAPAPTPAPLARRSAGCTGPATKSSSSSRRPGQRTPGAQPTLPL